MKRIVNPLKSASRLVGSAAPEANLLAITAAVLLALKILILNRLSEAFPGAYETGLIIEAILVSVIASYVFYLFAVHIPEYKNCQKIEPFASKHLRRIVGEAKSVLTEISQASGVTLDISKCEREELLKALRMIAIESESPLVIGPESRPATWLEFFQYRANRTRSSALKLMQRMSLLSGSRIRLVTEIDDCVYFLMLDSYVARNHRNGNLEFIADSQLTYLELCNELRILEHME